MKIVGQDQLLSNIDNIFKIFQASESQIRPHFILAGPSGSGKTLTIAQLAAQYKFHFLEINAAQLTKEGTSGNSLSKALSPLISLGNKQAVVFVDEFDKLFISGNSNSQLAHETTTGVQNEFLKVVESDSASVFGDYGKYVNVLTKNVLFVFAGAFNNEEDITLDKLRQIGLKTEFLGRVGLVFNTKALTVEDLYKIVDESQLIVDYCKLFVDVDYEKTKYLIKDALSRNFQFNTIGARLINNLVHKYFVTKSLDEQDEKKIAFQNKLTFNDNINE